MKFGRLTVLSRSEPDVRKRRAWICICECGKERIVDPQALKKGSSKSCGCLRDELCTKNNTTHGESNRTPEYSSWCKMKERCFDKKCPAYKDYGGRGISACERWLNSYENFLEDMGRRPNGTSLERKNNSLGYSKENCKWATQQEQNNNKRSNRKITYLGETLNLFEMARRYGVDPKLFHQRLKLGYSVERALTKKLPCRNS